MSPNARMGLIAILFVGGILLCSGAGVGAYLAWQKKVAQPPTKAEAPKGDSVRSENVNPADPETWDLRELTEYLKRQGFPKIQLMTGQYLHPMQLWLYGGDDQHRLYVEGMFKNGFLVPWVVEVLEYRDAAAVARRMREMADNELKTHWPWKKFIFVCDDTTAANLKKVLK